jgi:hypothetical protein
MVKTAKLASQQVSKDGCGEGLSRRELPAFAVYIFQSWMTQLIQVQFP